MIFTEILRKWTDNFLIYLIYSHGKYQYSVVGANMKNILLFAEILPLILFYLFFANSDFMIWFSLSYLGKLCAILIIIFYSSIHWIYGLFFCVVVILYYQSDLIEGMQTPIPAPTSMNTNNGQFIPDHLVNEEVMKYSVADDFIYLDDTTQITTNITDLRLKTQEEIVYPKASDDWVNGIWQSWFVDEYTVPYPVSSNNAGLYPVSSNNAGLYPVSSNNAGLYPSS